MNQQTLDEYIWLTEPTISVDFNNFHQFPFNNTPLKLRRSRIEWRIRQCLGERNFGVFHEGDFEVSKFIQIAIWFLIEI